MTQVMDVTNGYGADVNLEGTGHPSALIQGLDLLRTLGTFVEYGVFGSDFTVDWSIISDDKELKRPRGAPRPNCWPAAIRMIESEVLGRTRSSSTTTAGRVPEMSRYRVQRQGVRQSVPDSLSGCRQHRAQAGEGHLVALRHPVERKACRNS
ncbi:MAG TPA: hypothetical protein VK390_01260 [Propionibacteriaceae bacterium]|nr:hypothetical protein [Propionibacteriaceae bacterium]